MANAHILTFICLSVMISAAMGFRSFVQPPRLCRTSPMRMSDSEKPHTSLMPAEKVQEINAAAVSGGFVGFVLGGPLLGLILAAVSNFVAKGDNESAEILRGFGRVVVDSYNFLTKVNNKYDLTGKAGKAVTNVVDSAATENETVEKIKTSYASAVEKLEDLNKEYDLVTKGKEVVVAAATLSDAAIEKAIELNSKYELVNKATKAVASAVGKVADQSQKD